MVNLGILISSEPQLTNWIGILVDKLYQQIGNFGWTVVIFTLILKVIVSPFDFWQKASTRKNNRAMKLMKPELDRINESYAGNPQVLQKKQMELYKQYGYSMWGACLPSLLTLVIFLVVFSGFNACVKYENQMMVYQLTQTYKQEVVEAGKLDVVSTGDAEADAAKIAATNAEIDATMLRAYEELKTNPDGSNRWKWLWVENVFMPDNWADVVPDISTYAGTGMGKLNASLTDVNFPYSSQYGNAYDALLKPAMREYNKVDRGSSFKTFWDVKHWNGYLILPILSLALSIFSMRLTKGTQPETPTRYDAEGKPIPGSNANSMKYMMWLMPIMIGVFSLFYSAAFCIYMFTNSFMTVGINLVYNAVTKHKDKAEGNA
jgi:YidC/Oxa1 family membrane protein insertase